MGKYNMSIDWQTEKNGAVNEKGGDVRIFCPRFASVVDNTGTSARETTSTYLTFKTIDYVALLQSKGHHKLKKNDMVG